MCVPAGNALCGIRSEKTSSKFEAKIIPVEHRTNIYTRNRTDGIFGIHGIDFENLYIGRIFYSKDNNNIYLKF